MVAETVGPSASGVSATASNVRLSIPFAMRLTALSSASTRAGLWGAVHDLLPLARSGSGSQLGGDQGRAIARNALLDRDRRVRGRYAKNELGTVTDEPALSVTRASAGRVVTEPGVDRVGAGLGVPAPNTSAATTAAAAAKPAAIARRVRWRISGPLRRCRRVIIAARHPGFPGQRQTRGAARSCDGQRTPRSHPEPSVGE